MWMWRWIKSTIFTSVANFFPGPVANFFSGMVASIRNLFASDQRRAEYQAIPSDLHQNDAPAQADANLHPVEPKPVAIESLVRPGQSDNAESPSDRLIMDIFTHAMPAAGVSNNQITAVMGKLSSTCISFHGFFNRELIKRARRQLWQAVIDDDRQTVKRILDSKPELLLDKAQRGVEIQSQYTWVMFDVENKDALSIAARFKQIKMIELLLPYYDKLEQTEDVIKAKAESLAAWKAYDIQMNAKGKKEIVILRLYADYAKSLIDVFKEETFPNGTEGKFSEKTEDALKLLFDILLPKRAVKLDDYIDPELFLLALYQAYGGNFYSFQNQDQRDAFCVRIIGLAQSVLPPEKAKSFCEGLYGVVKENRKISARADSLKLWDGKTFYRASRESVFGLGFEYVCSAAGQGVWTMVALGNFIWDAMSSKNKNFLERYAVIAAAKPILCKS